jgi:hypothetical protein
MMAADNCSDDRVVDNGRSVQRATTSPSFLQEIREHPTNPAAKNQSIKESHSYVELRK